MGRFVAGIWCSVAQMIVRGFSPTTNQATNYGLMYTVKFVLLTSMVCIFRLLFFVLQFIATYFSGGIIITISLHRYMYYFQ